jgi:hypothetical protein
VETGRSTPLPVSLAAFVALAKAAFLVIMGIIGFAAADSVSDSFGGGVFLFGLGYGLVGFLLLRGSRVARDALGFLSAVTAAVGLVYAFTGPAGAVVPSLVAVAFAVGVIALLYLPAASKAYFARR